MLHWQMLMLCTFLSPEVPIFSLPICVLLGYYKDFMLDLAAPFPFERIYVGAHWYKGKADIIRHNAVKPYRLAPNENCKSVRAFNAEKMICIFI